MASISKPNTFSANTTALSSEVNANFDTIYNDYNGNINSDNLATDAVTTAKIADSAVTTAKINANAITPAKLDTDLVGGWQSLSGTHSVATTYNAGNRSFTVDTSADHSTLLSPGMRYRVTRNTTPPTQCADLEASSSHYASKSSPTGLTAQDDVTFEAWVKLESYTAGVITSRYNAGGISMRVESDGRVGFYGFSGSGANYRGFNTYQSIPLNKWTHIAVQLDMSAYTASSTTMYCMIDGVDVPISLAQGGTNPTTFSLSGDLLVGALGSGTVNFDGKLSDIRWWSDKRTQDEIKDNMYAYPSNTTGLVAHFKLNGDFTDASSNGNDLTAQNSAVATNADNPWNATEYGIITAVSASDIQVFCPEGYGIPNETLTAPYYSTQKTPYGFPMDKSKWVLGFEHATTQTLSVANTNWQATTVTLTGVPIGSWDVLYETYLAVTLTSTNGGYFLASISTDGSTPVNSRFTSVGIYDQSTATSTTHSSYLSSSGELTLTSQTTLTVLAAVTATLPSAFVRGLSAINERIEVVCAYL